ncbi:hypothetical protein, partial [Acinetobacter baumannii]|uniref:hypothetical protein n=1 Tax=Acinetobacter baumannii TaxID=470 RepID=UPI001C080735
FQAVAVTTLCLSPCIATQAQHRSSKQDAVLSGPSVLKKSAHVLTSPPAHDAARGQSSCASRLFNGDFEMPNETPSGSM